MLGLLDRATVVTTHAQSRMSSCAPNIGRAVLNIFCKLAAFGCIYCLPIVGALRAQQAGDDQAPHHHPPQDMALHEKFYSNWHMPDKPAASCCNNADCYPTEIKFVDGRIYAKRREDGKFILVPAEKVERNRDNPDGRNHLCAPPPNFSHTSDTVFCFALGGST